jgi:hypothetical protein
MNLAALWRLPVVFMVTNNQFGMGTSLERHSAVTDLQRKGEGFGVPGTSCDGMDVLDTYNVCCQALRVAREEHRPTLVEARTYRFRGHSMADPEEYRTREQVELWRQRDPIAVFAQRLIDAGVLSAQERDELDGQALERLDRAVEFAEASEFPSPDSLYDNVYVLGDQVRGWYSVDARTPTPHRGEDEREMPAEALAGTEDYERAVREPAGPGPSDAAQDEGDEAAASREPAPYPDPDRQVKHDPLAPLPDAEHDAIAHRGET